jgi:hypothetical protein
MFIWNTSIIKFHLPQAISSLKRKKSRQKKKADSSDQRDNEEMIKKGPSIESRGLM